MKQYEDSGSFIPDQHRDSPFQASAISPTRRRWRAPAVVTSTAAIAAICLYTGSAAHATEAPSVAKVSANAAVRPATTATQGGVHGAFNLYNGAGGGLEFWFDPSTGSLTVAVGTGIGAIGGGVLGTYAYGTAPAAGNYLYADALLSAGTVVTVNLAGTYTLVNGVFHGSVSATIEGRTLTITSDGSSTFTATVVVASGAAQWSGAYYYDYVYYFSFPDVVEYIYDPIIDFDPGDYSLVDTDAGNSGTTPFAGASGTDDSQVTGSTSNSSSDDSSDSDDDASDGDTGGGGGGGGTSDDGHAPIDEE